MTVFVFRNGRFVDRHTGEPMLTGERRIACPSVVPDLPAYASPLGDGTIEGRAARREHLKRTGCRALEPGEWKPAYTDRAARVEAQLRTLATRN